MEVMVQIWCSSSIGVIFPAFELEKQIRNCKLGIPYIPFPTFNIFISWEKSPGKTTKLQSFELTWEFRCFPPSDQKHKDNDTQTPQIAFVGITLTLVESIGRSNFWPKILLMEEILQQLIYGKSPIIYRGILHPRRCRISPINSVGPRECHFWAHDLWRFELSLLSIAEGKDTYQVMLVDFWLASHLVRANNIESIPYHILYIRPLQLDYHR